MSSFGELRTQYWAEPESVTYQTMLEPTLSEAELPTLRNPIEVAEKGLESREGGAF
jgi:hypothetical protein